MAKKRKIQPHKINKRKGRGISKYSENSLEMIFKGVPPFIESRLY
jgi:hypothetical protein